METIGWEYRAVYLLIYLFVGYCYADRYSVKHDSPVLQACTLVTLWPVVAVGRVVMILARAIVA